MSLFSKENADFEVRIIIVEKSSGIRDEVMFPCNLDSVIFTDLSVIVDKISLALHVRKRSR